MTTSRHDSGAHQPPPPKSRFSNIQTQETARTKHRIRQRKLTYLLEHLDMCLLNFRKINCVLEMWLGEKGSKWVGGVQPRGTGQV